MGFQTHVPLGMPAGYPGGWPTANNNYCVAAMAGAPITPGTFVSVAGQTNADSIPMNPDVVTPGGAAALGIAIRARIGTFNATSEEYSNAIPQNFPVELVVRGDVFVQAVDATDLAKAVRGAKVFYNTTTGVPTFDAAGATVADATESDWYVVKVVDADNLLVFVSTERKR